MSGVGLGYQNLSTGREGHSGQSWMDISDPPGLHCCSQFTDATAEANDHQPILPVRQAGRGGPGDGECWLWPRCHPSHHHPQSFGLITCTGKARRGPRRHRAPKGHWVRFSSFPPNDIPPVDSVVLTMPAVGINRAAPTHQLSPVSFRSPPLSFGF